MKITDTAQANSLLPQTKNESIPNPLSLVYLFIAPPKWGKTTWMCNIPDSLLLAFERGASFQKAYKISIKGWAGDDEIEEDEEGVKFMTMEMVMKLLEKSDRFPFIIFDTADMAAKICSDYFCKRNNLQHVSEGGDFGKGYDILQNSPFRQLVGSIMRTGRGIGFITHSTVNTVELKGQKKSKRETSLPGGIYKFIHTQADVIMHGSFGIRQKGNKHYDRIIQTAGDEETLAGSRCSVKIPSKFIMDSTDPWKQWTNFFENPNAAAEAERDYDKSFHRDSEIEPESESEPSSPTPRKKGK